MMTPWKKKKIKKLKEEEKKLETELIEFIGVDNDKYWTIWLRKEEVVDQIIRETGR